MNLKVSSDPPATDDSRRERLLVILLCAFAAVRVLAYCLIFPVFNNVDEAPQYDLVRQYSRLQAPRAGIIMSHETALAVLLYGTPEYIKTPDMYPDGRIRPPTWTMTPQQVNEILDKYMPLWAVAVNYEEAQPPLYYVLAGAWMALGHLAGISEALLPYWVRVWNILPAAALVWLAWKAAALVFSARRDLRLAVAILAAAIPQDAFYGIQNDVLSPVCFGLAFIGLIRVLSADVISLRLAALTGLMLAATCLVKISNLPLLAVGLAAAAFRAWRIHPAIAPARPTGALLLLGLCAVVPVLGLFAWNLHVFGDLTGAADKIAALGWTRKPFGQWWSHPLFSIGGLYSFWSELTASFWRGEYVWETRRLAWPAMDAFYWASSAVFLALGAARLTSGATDPDAPRRRALWLGFWSFLSGVAFLALISVMFDYGKCVYPSEAHPYFTSGRLVFVALAPFLLLYVWGLDWPLARAGLGRLTLPIVAAIAVAITLSELFINLPPLSSPYSLFHLLARAN
jgi:hypothetical protein